MQCREFRNQHELWMEGEPSAEAAAHLNVCADCRSLVADLRAIETAAVDFAEAEPPAHLWTSLRNQLQAEGLIRETVAAETVSTWSLAGFFASLQSPALAGAYLALVLAVAGLFAWHGNVSAPTVAVQPTVTMPAHLQTVSDNRESVANMHEHNPMVRDSYQKNLEIVDNFIALCEKSVHDEPGNAAAREYLYGAYRQKAELLASVTERGAMGD